VQGLFLIAQNKFKPYKKLLQKIKPPANLLQISKIFNQAKQPEHKKSPFTLRKGAFFEWAQQGSNL
jgi:hypothetical protein